MFAGTHAYFSMQETRACSVNYFCFGALLIFVGSILFCALGFIIILPFESTKKWQKQQCTVISSAINISVCGCEEEHSNFPGCEEYYPCLQVYVTHALLQTRSTNITRVHKATQSDDVTDCARSQVGCEKEQKMSTTLQIPIDKGNTTIYSDSKHQNNQRLHGGKFIPLFKRNHLNSDIKKRSINDTHLGHGDQSIHHRNTGSEQDVPRTLLYRSWKDIYYEHCTLQECGDKEWNIKSTRKFHSDYGHHGSVFDCYVDPQNTNVVIMERTPFWSMVHAVLWPSVCLFVGVILLLGLCCGCWSVGDNDYQASACYTT